MISPATAPALRRSASTTAAPCIARCSANARPIPLPAPVMRAALPWRSVMGTSSEADRDVLGLEKLVHTQHSEVLAESGLFVPSHRRVRVGVGSELIDPDCARLQSARRG